MAFIKNGIFREQEIIGLTLVSAVGCNLNCEYCLIEKSVKDKHDKVKELQEKTIESFKNGSYLENIKKTLMRLGTSPSRIEVIQIWGQEPTLTLNHLTDNLSDWLNVFTKANRFMFSTNGMNFTNKILDFIKTLDDNLKHRGKFELQISFDGIDQTDNLRKASSELILSNTKYLINKLNEISLKNLDVMIQFHGVLTADMVRKLNSTDKIQDYALSNAKIINELYDLNSNLNVEIVDGISFSQEMPQKASKEDGINLANFYRLGSSIDASLFRNRIGTNLWNGLVETANINWNNFLGRPFTNIENFLEEVLTSYNDITKIQNFSSQMYCGANYDGLKIMYDGTLLPCQNHMYEIDPDSIVDDGTIEAGTKKYLAKFNGYINVLKDTDLKIENNLNMYQSLRQSSYYYTFSQVFSLMYYCMLSNQIDATYKTDLDKMLLHAAILAAIHQCSYNNIVMTGSALNKWTGMIRLYCNGYLDYVVNRYRENTER